MEFALVCIGMIVVLGVIALVANYFDKGEDTIETGRDCSTCTAAPSGAATSTVASALRYFSMSASIFAWTSSFHIFQ